MFPTIKRFLSPLKGDRKFLTKAIVWFSFWGVDAMFIAYIVKSITQNIQNGDIGAFHQNILLFSGGIALFHALTYGMMRWGYVDFHVKERLNKELLPSFFYIENNFYEMIGTGRSLSILQRGIDVWATLLHEMMIYIPQSIISLAMSVYIIWAVNGYYLLVFIVLLLIVAYLIQIMQQKGIAHRKIRKGLESEYARQFIRNIMSKFEILQSNKVNTEVANLNEKLHEILDIEKKKHTYEHITYNIGNIVTNIIRGGLLFLVGTKILQGTANYSDFILAIMIIGYFETSVLHITSIYKKTMKNFPDVLGLWEFIDESPKLQNITEGAEFQYKRGDIQVANVVFGYNDSSSVFQDFSISLRGQTRTAFVGESGGGKTTLIKLLAGYITPNQGDIIIDGQKLSETKLMDYYKHIGYLTQDPGVFDGSIYENLTYALDHKPTSMQIDTVIRDAKCDFILDFEKGLETEIGERGVRLSGGQKQRLAIAKIMLKNPDIIFLDEPTSALDSFNEEQINIALHNLFQNKTVIIIAHRLQTVKTADRILLFEKGHVIEDGTHEELMQLKGKYARMLELQSGF